MTSEEHINSESNKDYDVDDMDGVSDELETHDSEEPTEEQKAFYISQNPRDIKQKEEWFPTEKKASNNDDDKRNPNDPKIKKALDISQKFTHKLFIDAYKEPYAAVPIEDHIEVFAINSKKFRNWIRMIVYNKEGITIDGQTLNDLCSLLAAYAEFQNKEQIDLHLRNASNADGELEWRYDLTNKNWEFVKNLDMSGF